VPARLLANRSILTLMRSFGKFFQHLANEGREVLRIAAGDQTLIDNHLAIDPFAARVLNVGM